MVQGAVLVTAIGLAAFFLLIPASIWLLKSVLGGIGEPATEGEPGDRSEPPGQGSSA
ncbi:MAG: hypothetical protein ABEJ94_10435 [Halorientalis sp.]